MLSSATRLVRLAAQRYQPAVGEASSSRQMLQPLAPRVHFPRWQATPRRELQISAVRRDVKDQAARAGKGEAAVAEEQGAAATKADIPEGREADVAMSQDAGGPGPKPPSEEGQAVSNSSERLESTEAPRPESEQPVMASTLPGLGLSESLRAPPSSSSAETTPDRPAASGPSSSPGRYSPVSLKGTTEPFHLHIQSTRNNTIMTLTTSQGLPLSNVSCGSVGFKKSARSSYDAAYRTAITMFQRIEQNRVAWRLANLELVWKGFGQGREAVFRALQTDEGTFVRNLVRRMRDATDIKIGGVRPRKRRML